MDGSCSQLSAYTRLMSADPITEDVVALLGRIVDRFV
jgi:hypothetical protein